MARLRADRLWIIAGTLGAVVLLLGGWFLLISPQRATTSELTAEVTEVQQRRATLQRRLVLLEQQRGNLDQYRSELTMDRQALPSSPELSAFLRELHDAGTKTGVAVSGLLVGSASTVANRTPEVIGLPLTLTAVGTIEATTAFLDQIQLVQPRAVLIGNLNAAPGGDSATLSDSITLTISLQVFIQPAT